MFSLEACQLTRRLNGRLILSGLDLRVAAGEIVAIRGCNGAGKTTLLRCLAGLLRPSAGEVRWLGAVAASCVASRRLVGFAAHECGVYSELSVRDNLLFAARMLGINDSTQSVSRAMEDSGLARRAGQAAGQLSKGLQRRLSIARALLHEPKIAILDEPFSSLDEDGRAWLEEKLLWLKARSCAICLTGHDAAQTARMADVELELRDGNWRLPPDCQQLLWERSA